MQRLVLAGLGWAGLASLGWLCRTGLGQARLGWVCLISWFSWLAVLLQHFSIANGCTRHVGQPIRLRRVTTTQRRRSDPIPDAACRRATRADPIRFHSATQPIRSDSPRQHMSPIRSDVDSHDDTIAHDQTPHQQGHDSGEQLACLRRYSLCVVGRIQTADAVNRHAAEYGKMDRNVSG